MNPKDWLEFLEKAAHSPMQALLALTMLLSVYYFGLATQAKLPPFERPTTNAPALSDNAESGSPSPRSNVISLTKTTEATPAASASPPNASCENNTPHDGGIEGGRFQVRDACIGLSNQVVFVVMRNLVPSSERSEIAPRYWIQDQVKVKQSGDLLGEAFGCVDGAQYEVMLVYPKTTEALIAYGQWLRQESSVGKSQLPYLSDVSLLGKNRAITINHEISAPPSVCFGQGQIEPK